MVNPNVEHWKGVKQAIGYMATKTYQGMISQQLKNLQPYIYANLDYASDEGNVCEPAT